MTARISAILTRLSETERSGHIRSAEILGYALEGLPKVGHSFRLLSTPLEPKADFRLVSTSEVREIRLHPEEGSLEFWTISGSWYGLQVLDMEIPEGTLPN